MKPYWQATSMDLLLINEQNRDFWRPKPVQDAVTMDVEVLLLKRDKTGAWVLKDRRGAELGKAQEPSELREWARANGYNLREETL